MNVFKLKLERNARYESEAEQIYNYLDTYMGQPGLEEIGNFVSESEHFEIIGKFARAVFKDANKEPNYIHGLVFFEDDFGNFLECLHTYQKDGEIVLHWSR